MKIDFETLRTLSKIAKDDYSMGGAVQHGASTLPDDAFDMFPKVETLEVHLATGFQNIIYDSKDFPPELTRRIHDDIIDRYSGERKAEDTEDQFIYKTRKKSLGDFKKELWSLPDERKASIMQELEDRFDMMFGKLNCTHTRELVDKYIKY